MEWIAVGKINGVFCTTAVPTSSNIEVGATGTPLLKVRVSSDSTLASQADLGTSTVYFSNTGKEMLISLLDYVEVTF